MTGAELLVYVREAHPECSCAELLDGCVLLTAEEAEKVRQAFELWAVAHHLSGHEIEVRGEVLALLGGEKP